MSEIFYVNSASIEVLEVSTSLAIASGAALDLTGATVTGLTVESASHATNADTSSVTFQLIGSADSSKVVKFSGPLGLTVDNSGVTSQGGFTGSLVGNADTATSAAFATNASTATSASHALTADTATSADSATTATSASHALASDTAVSAAFADNATSASYAPSTPDPNTILQGGNAFGANASIGLTDDYKLDILHNNAAAITMVTGDATSKVGVFTDPEGYGVLSNTKFVVAGEQYVDYLQTSKVASWQGTALELTAHKSEAWLGVSNTDSPAGVAAIQQKLYCGIRVRNHATQADVTNPSVIAYGNLEVSAEVGDYGSISTAIVSPLNQGPSTLGSLRLVGIGDGASTGRVYLFTRGDGTALEAEKEFVSGRDFGIEVGSPHKVYGGMEFFTASYAPTAGVTSSLGFLGNVEGTASFAVSASWAPSGNSESSSYSDYAANANFATTAGTANTASYVDAAAVNGTVNSALTASYLVGGTGDTRPVKVGVVSGSQFTGTSSKVYGVVFAAPFADDEYAVQITGEPSRAWSVSGKSANGFTIEANSNVAFTGKVWWTCNRLGEYTV